MKFVLDAVGEALLLRVRGRYPGTVDLSCFLKISYSSEEAGKGHLQ